MHNGTLISDLQSLVTKFGSGGHHADGTCCGLGTVPGGIGVQAPGEESLDKQSAGTTPRSVTCDVVQGELSAQAHSQTTEVGTQSDPLPIQSSPDLSSASPSAGEGLVVDELTYRSYRHNRVTNPHIEAWRWARLFGDSSVRWMEDRYQAEIRGCDADVMTGLDDSIRCGSSEICGECLNCKSHCVCGGVA